MNWFRKMMMGRYGGDQLGMFLILLSLVLSIVLMFVHVPYIEWVSWAPLAWALFRVFSKQTSKRRMENEAFMRVWNRLRAWWWRMRNRLREMKTHRYFKCPKCGKELRVPRGKGKISITCPQCGNKFVRKT